MEHQFRDQRNWEGPRLRQPQRPPPPGSWCGGGGRLPRGLLAPPAAAAGAGDSAEVWAGGRAVAPTLRAADSPPPALSAPLSQLPTRPRCRAGPPPQCRPCAPRACPPSGPHSTAPGQPSRSRRQPRPSLLLTSAPSTSTGRPERALPAAGRHPAPPVQEVDPTRGEAKG